MKMNFYYFISKKFSNSTLPNSGLQHFLLSLGVGVGCFALVITISVLNGFEKLVHDKLKGFNGDLRISGDITQLSIKDLQNLVGIEYVVPYMERKGIISSDKEHRVVTLKAVDMKNLYNVYKMIIKESSIKNDEIVVGQNIALRLNVDVGDEIFVSSPIDQSFVLGIPLQKKMKIGNIFSTNVLDYDDTYVFLPMETGKVLFKRKQIIDGYELRLNSKSSVSEVKSNLLSNFPGTLIVQSWEDLNHALVKAMELEKKGAILILSLIFLVASFNIASILSLISLQKIKNIGILKMLGARGRYLKVSLFLIGLKRGGTGIFFGTICGTALVLLQNRFNFIPIPDDVYFISALPMVLYFKDIFIILIISFVFVFFGCFISSHKVTGLKPIKALKWVK